MIINLILYSDLDASNGGVETWLRQFLLEINNNPVHENVKIIIYYFPNPAKDINLVRSLAPSQFTYVPISLPEGNGLLSSFLKLFRFHHEAIKKIKTTEGSVVLSVGSYPSGVFSYISLKLLRYRKHVKHLIWLRTTLSKYIKNHRSRIFSKLILGIERRALNNADLVISNGWDTCSNYQEEQKVASFVIPNAVNIQKYSEVGELSFKKPPVLRIAFIGRFYESKGSINFINAIKIFNQEFDTIARYTKFVFVGFGENEVEEFARSTSNCELVGRISNDHMPELLNDIHAGLVLTKANKSDPGGSGISNSLLELMATGRIIIAYDNNIYRQFPRQDFLTYVPENEDGILAELFADIYSNWSIYHSRAQNAKDYVQEFSIDQHVNTFLQKTLSIK